MISAGDFRNGVTFEMDSQVFKIVEFQHVKPGKGGAFVRTKLRNLRTGSVNDITFTAGEKMDQAIIEKKKMQYLYGGETYCFMDMETYDQVEIPEERLEWEKQFLLEGQIIEIVFYGSEILGVNLPEKMTFVVTEAAPAVSGNTATNALKEVTIETGLVVKVPLFIDQGEKIVVTTFDGKYSCKG
jgi:elongation factor P